MIKITQRFPNFFSGFTPEKYEIESLEQLLNLPFIQRWKNDKEFKQFSVSRNHLLMAGMLDKSYWAIAFLEGTIENLNLPEWHREI